MRAHTTSLALTVALLVGRGAASNAETRRGALRRTRARRRDDLVRIPESDFMKEVSALDEDASFWSRELSAFSASMSMPASGTGGRPRTSPAGADPVGADLSKLDATTLVGQGQPKENSDGEESGADSDVQNGPALVDEPGASEEATSTTTATTEPTTSTAAQAEATTGATEPPPATTASGSTTTATTRGTESQEGGPSQIIEAEGAAGSSGDNTSGAQVASSQKAAAAAASSAARAAIRGSLAVGTSVAAAALAFLL